LALPLIDLLADDVERGRDGEMKKDEVENDCPLLNKYEIDGDILKGAKDRGKNAFLAAMNDWPAGGPESAFTDGKLCPNLEQELKELMKKEGTDSEQPATQESGVLNVDFQCEVKGRGEWERKKKGKIDIMIWERDGSKNSRAFPLCTIEFGKKGNFDWWEKIGQALHNAGIMRNSRSSQTPNSKNISEFTFDQPMIASSVIVGKKDGKVDGDFGVFLCVPVSKSDGSERDYRAILLWRKRVENNLDAAAEAFGKIVQASIALHCMRVQTIDSSFFEPLGPDCAIIDGRLYRSYDNRLRCIYRSPDPYFHNGPDNVEEKQETGFHSYPTNSNEGPDDHEEAKIVFDARDRANIKDLHPFGDPLPSQDINTGKTIDSRGLLWENRGRFLVISVPFREGTHEAKKVSHFIPILKHLQHLHNHNKVHGDIRAFNIIFKDKEKGWLIDLDYGGVCGEKKYPEGFNFYLADGHRLEPVDLEKDNPIRKFDDIYALWKVFDLHIIKRDSVGSAERLEVVEGQLSFQDKVFSAADIFLSLPPEATDVPKVLKEQMATFIKTWWKDEGSGVDINIQNTADFDTFVSKKLGEDLMNFFDKFSEIALQSEPKFRSVAKKLESNKNNRQQEGQQASPQRVKTQPGVATGSYLPKKNQPEQEGRPESFQGAETKPGGATDSH